MTLQAKSQNNSHLVETQAGTKFIFWQRWLLAASIVLAVFGVLMAFLNRTTFFDIFNTQINPIFWGTTNIPAGAAAFQGFVYGVAGAITAGWGITLAFIAHYAFKQQEKWAWICILESVLVWYLIDTFISVQFNVYFNAISNTVFLTVFLLPLIFTRKDFK
ncbi:MAG: hypothetical protein GY796_35375 [Chloroflexi bacterium]|nr:hypothetical protein [Chloroflexota bacterium]